MRLARGGDRVLRQWPDKARADAELVLKRIAPQNDDARVLVAAARLAYDEDPARFVSSGAGARIMQRIEDKRDDGVRAAGMCVARRAPCQHSSGTPRRAKPYTSC